MKNNVLVAMSGGVDSSAAALLLRDQGFAADGATMLFYESSPSEESLQTAMETCRLLRMEHYVFDFRESFKENVIKYFVDSYLKGETPNPCVECNKKLKFSQYIFEAEKLGYEKVATGHYARVEYDGASGRWLLKKGVDPNKDQSYFLYALTQNDLAHTVFPLGGLLKSEIREISQQAGLPSVHRAESQDVCFLPDGDYRGFIEREMGCISNPGNFIDTDGNVIGKHIGTMAYTIGQRRGLGVSADSRLYVIGKDVANNTVTLGREENMYTSRVVLRDINLIATDKISSSVKVEAKVRYSKSTAEAVLFPETDGAVLEFTKPVRMPAAGQVAVFYDGDTVIGGGTVC